MCDERFYNNHTSYQEKPLYVTKGKTMAIPQNTKEFMTSKFIFLATFRITSSVQKLLLATQYSIMCDEKFYNNHTLYQEKQWPHYNLLISFQWQIKIFSHIYYSIMCLQNIISHTIGKYMWPQLCYIHMVQVTIYWSHFYKIHVAETLIYVAEICVMVTLSKLSCGHFLPFSHTYCRGFLMPSN